MFEHFTLFISLIVFIALISWLDKRFQWGLAEQTGMSSSDFWGTEEAPADNVALKSLEDENQALRQRIEVLEKIVTEPSYELNKEIEKLK